jgi:formylmethanofuran dehydrogenase subunit E
MQKSKVKIKNYNSKLKIRKILETAIDFHGHLGPYLVLGLRMGELAIAKLRCKKHFGIRVLVKGAVDRPKSCIVDGLQLSTGCTYGKGNILKSNGKQIRAFFLNLDNNKRITVSLKNGLSEKLQRLKGHKDSELFAKQLLDFAAEDLFKF